MRVSLLGVEFYSENRGCGALAYSIVEILKQICKKKGDNLHITAILFSNHPVVIKDDDIEVTIECIKIAPKKFTYWKACKRAFADSDFILDFSMGDSFADIYGMKRFFLASMLKELAIKSKTEFIMAPQTIGPFSRREAKLWASHILKACNECFVRDTFSKKYVKELCGRNALLTTDVAFALPYKERIIDKKEGIVRVGLNPSGLLWGKESGFDAEKHVSVDYKEYIECLMQAWKKDEMVEIYLIPHVFAEDGSGMEDDLRVCKELHKKYPATVLETGARTPMEIKSIIASMDVFTGARMHATIAAFSSGVATIPFSYSRKFEGLYHDLGYAYLISGASTNTQEAVKKTLAWVKEYKKLRENVKECRKNIPDKQRVFLDVLKNM